MTINGAIDNLATRQGKARPSYVELTAAPGSLTAKFGVDFPGLATVQAQIGGALSFRSTTGTDPTTDSCLRSTLIDLSGVMGATLTFAQARDFPAGGTAVVNIIDESTGNPITSGPFPLTDHAEEAFPGCAGLVMKGPF